MSQTTRINANDINVYLGFDATRATSTTGAAGERIPIANLMSGNLDIVTDMLDVTTKASNRWKETIPGQRSWSITADFKSDNLIQTITDGRTAAIIQEYAISGANVYLEFGVANARFVGTARISSFNPGSGGTNEAGQGSITFDGNGQLEFDSDVSS